MRFVLIYPRTATSVPLALIACVAFLTSNTASAQHYVNPITRLARWTNPDLIQVEERIDWLRTQNSTFAEYYQFPLRYDIGYRGGRIDKDSPEPTIMMDLGKSYPLSSIYLIPLKAEYLNDPGIFPRSFTIEISNDPNFEQSKIIHTLKNNTPSLCNNYLYQVITQESGRYIKISIHNGCRLENMEIFGLAEIFVISQGNPVSFNAKITCTGALDDNNIWNPQALNDGRSPLGIWHNGTAPHAILGDSAPCANDAHSTTWSITLPSAEVIDTIILFPYLLNRSYQTSILPETIEIKISAAPNDPAQTVYQWKCPLANSNQAAPLVIPLHQTLAHTIHVVATQPRSIIGSLNINALAEIQVWSGKINLAKNLPVTRVHNEAITTVTSLTDGYSSNKKIISIDQWLNQIHKSGMIEEELKKLQSIYRDLSVQAELNVTWASSVLLGLTLLIPVFIFERRRIKSREQLDTIRKRIASDLHDDIGSNLGSISLIARTARKNLARLHGPPEVDEDLKEVETIARESSLAMRDIVWLLEKRQDSIGDLVYRMRETANRLLRGFELTLECHSNKTTTKLSLDAKRHLFLFYKEAIHNIAKHSKANRVSIRLWDEGEQLALEIQDNGIGLPASNGISPVNVKKLQDRCEVLDGTLEVTSTPETGTCLKLLVTRSHLTSQFNHHES